MADKGTYWQRTGRSPLTRRRILKGAALSGAGLTVAVIGCAQEERTPAGAPGAARQPRRGGTLVRVGGSQDFPTQGRPLDPHTESVSVARTLRFVYQSLLGYKFGTYELDTDLAQAWEQPSPTEYLLKLPPGAKWQNKPPANGRDLTADDVVFSLDRVRTDNPRFQHRSFLVGIDQVSAIDKSTVKITTKQPDASTLMALAADGVAVMNPETVEKADRFQSPDEVVGSGAFILKTREERVRSEYVCNPDYFRSDLPYLDAVILPFIADREASYAAFLAGRADIVEAPGSQAKQIAARQSPDYTPGLFEGDSLRLLTPNVQKKPFDDPRVTRALRLLVNHDEMITAYAEVVSGDGRHGSIFPAALRLWDLSQDEYKKIIFWRHPKDQAIREAISLLNAAGYTRDNTLSFELAHLDSPTINPGAELLDAQWRQNSQGVVRTTLKPSEAATWTTIRSRAQFDYIFQPIFAAVMDPGVWLDQLYRTGGSRNYGKFSDPKVDEMIDKQRTLFNTEERRAQVKEIVRFMAENAPLVSATLVSTLTVAKAKVRGYSPDSIINGRIYQFVWLEA